MLIDYSDIVPRGTEGDNRFVIEKVVINYSRKLFVKAALLFVMASFTVLSLLIGLLFLWFKYKEYRGLWSSLPYVL